MKTKMTRRIFGATIAALVVPKPPKPSPLPLVYGRKNGKTAFVGELFSGISVGPIPLERCGQRYLRAIRIAWQNGFMNQCEEVRDLEDWNRFDAGDQASSGKKFWRVA